MPNGQAHLMVNLAEDEFKTYPAPRSEQIYKEYKDSGCGCPRATCGHRYAKLAVEEHQQILCWLVKEPSSSLAWTLSNEKDLAQLNFTGRSVSR